jgi:hypothetical protein
MEGAMNRPCLLVLGVAIVAAALLAGCTSGSSLSRIDADRALYESWPLDIQEAVLNGKVVQGMDYDQVKMSVGKPAEKTVRNARKGVEEVWIYRSGGGGPDLGGLSVGGMVGGVGVSQQGTSGGGYSDEYEVVFVDGVVVRSTFPQ